MKLIDNKFTTLCYPFAAGNKTSNRVHIKTRCIPITMRIENHSNDGKTNGLKTIVDRDIVN